MKISKLQEGGFATYTPLNSPTVQLPSTGVPSQQASSNNEGEELLSKEVVKQLLENGLMNDVDLYMKNLSNMSTSLMNNPRAASQAMLNQYPQINKIIQNKQLLTDAIKKADENRGLGEYAITTTGQLIVRDEEGNLTQITPEELKKSSGDYQPLTNSELASLRQTNPSMAFNTNVFEVIGNGIGPDKITDYILGIASKIGYDKMSSEGYMSKKDENIAQGMEELLKGGEDGVYKITESQSSQNTKATQALKYIYSVLPQNMRNFLKVQAASQGQDPTKGAHELIATLISSTLNDETSTKVDYDATQSKAASGDKEGSGGAFNENQSIAILNGQGASRPFVLNPGSNYNFVMNMTHYQTPTDKTSNKAIGKSDRLDNLLQDSSWAGLVDTGAVYFGQQKVDESLFDRVVYDNSDGFGTVLLPYTMQDGHVTVDFNALEGIKNAQQESKDKGLTTDLEKQEIYSKYGVPQWYGIDKDPEFAKKSGLVRPFLVFTGLSTDNENVMSPDDPFVKVLNSQEKDNAKRKFLQVVRAPATKGGKPGNYDIDQWYNLFWDRNDVLSATVYMPLTQDYVTQYTANSSFKLPNSDANVHNILSRSQSVQRGFSPTITGVSALN